VYQKLSWFIEGTTFSVRRVVLVDARQNRNRFDFSFETFDRPPPQSEFLLQPPANTQVIQAHP
jgi:outer membrane lipoprotein-sorting protein